MTNKKKQPKEGRGLAGCLQVPAAAIPGLSHMEINGNREIIVDGCNGVLEYDTGIVRVKTGKLIVKFCGRGLTIKCLTADSLVVEGFVTGIEFLT